MRQTACFRCFGSVFFSPQSLLPALHVLDVSLLPSHLIQINWLLSGFRRNSITSRSFESGVLEQSMRPPWRGLKFTGVVHSCLDPDRPRLAFYPNSPALLGTPNSKCMPNTCQGVSHTVSSWASDIFMCNLHSSRSVSVARHLPGDCLLWRKHLLTQLLLISNQSEYL